MPVQFGTIVTEPIVAGASTPVRLQDFSPQTARTVVVVHSVRSPLVVFKRRVEGSHLGHCCFSFGALGVHQAVAGNTEHLTIA